ncbi:MAG TPA: AsmA family protein [Sphingomonas sp.]|nr:AsmA family protein [Sphingomonas sp.]
MADADAPVTRDQAAAPDARPARAIGTPLASVIAVVTTLIGLIVLAWAVLYITKGRFLKHPFERIVGGLTHREVKIRGDFQLYFDPITLRFRAEGLSIANPKWAGQPNLFSADRIDARIATLPSIFAKDRINWLDLQNGHVDLEWDKGHRTNTWTFSEKKGKPLELPLIRRALVNGTVLHYRDPKTQLSADIAVKTVRAQDTRFANAIRFSGHGSARGTPFTLAGALLSPNATVSGGENRLQLHIRGASTTADVAGTLPGATEIEGANLHADVRGGNLSDAFAVFGIAVPDTRAYRLTSALTKHDDEWRFTGLKGHFGDSDLAGKLTVALEQPRMKLTATLATHRLDIVDVGPFIGYNPDAAAKGKAGIVRRVGGTPRILPDAPLRIEALRNFDADVRYTVGAITGKNVPVSNIGLTLDLENSLLKLSPLTFDIAGGHLSSDIVINARRDPVDTDYDIRLSPTPMGRLLKGFGVSESGTTGTLKARIKMHGLGNTVHQSLANSSGRIAVILPAGTMWVRNVQLAELDIGTFIQKMFEHELKKPVEINCGLIAFTVRDGIAAADPILIDTKKNVMLGRGGFSFKNESLDLAFRADAKTFSLFSGQSPVGIQGYFAEPKLDVISPELLGRAGAALGLGIAVSPIAPIIAFIDPGDAKAAACGPVLAGANAQAQRTTKGKPRDDVGNGTTAKSESGKQSKSEEKKQHKKFLGIF